MWLVGRYVARRDEFAPSSVDSLFIWENSRYNRSNAHQSPCCLPTILSSGSFCLFAQCREIVFRLNLVIQIVTVVLKQIACFISATG